MSDTVSGAKGKTVHAGGAVLWRERDGRIEVAVVHRPRYDDWSLPKGKVEPGESLPITAVREISEETGFQCQLGRRLDTVKYPVGDTTKRVVYWAARTLGGEFNPNSEVDELRWLPVPEAMALLQYEYDRKVLRRFTEAPADTKTVLIVRHGRAGSRSKYEGDDAQRPLDKHGRAQAESLVGVLLAFGPGRLYAAPKVRCQQTLEPLAEELALPIDIETALTEQAYAKDTEAVRSRIWEIACAGGTPVICTQGAVIPDLIRWWSGLFGVEPDKSRNRKGGVWVLSVGDGRLVAADHIDSPLACGH